MYTASITGRLDGVQEYDDQPEIFSQDPSVVHLYSHLFRHAADFVRYVVVIACWLIKNSVRAVISPIS